MLSLQLFYIILPLCIASRTSQSGLLSSCVEIKNVDAKTQCRSFGSGFHSRTNSNEYGILKSPVGLDLGVHAAIVPHKYNAPHALVVPPRNTLSVFRHFWRFLRMFALSKSTPSLSALTFGRSLLASTLGSFLPVLVAYFSTCEPILAYLRKNWAFQGEVDNHPIETLVHAASAVLSAELLFRFLVLRLPFYSRLFRASGGYYGLERLHQLLCGVDRYSLIDALAVVIVLGRMGVLTMVHHLLSLENWNTAGFLVAPETSKIMGRFTRFLVVTSFLHELVNLVSSTSIESSLDIEHLLSPKAFRSGKISAALIDECKMCLYHMPEFFKGPIGGRTAQYIIGAWLALDSLTRALPQGLEWPFFWLNLTVALDSNSAAGLYLAAVQFVCLVLSKSIAGIEKAYLVHDVTGIQA